MGVHEQEDELGTVIKNKARLVAQSFSKEEGINYDKTFTLVARIEAIRIFLAFDTYMNFIVYQMDVKSAFLNGKLKEEVYVKQPYGFESSEFPDYVYKLEKAFYGLKQAPRASLQINQDEKGISICQEKYTRELLKKYEISDSSSVKTSMVPLNNLGHDLAGFDLKEYSDLDYAHCNMDRKSTSGCCQILGGKLVCWGAKKKQSVAMSSLRLNMLLLLGVMQTSCR
nr:copia protein [Tanacetum cinerariifolium]